MDDDVRRKRRERLEHAAEQHRDLPDELVEAQISKVDEAVDLMGGDPELDEAAEAAVEKNLECLRNALEGGAEIAVADPLHGDGPAEP